MAAEKVEIKADAPREGSILKSSNGWDGKLRVPKKAIVVQDQVSDPEDSDDDALPVEEIQADEDLLAEFDANADDIDLVHRGVKSMNALGLDKFKQVLRLCLRQNLITEIDLPESIGATLTDLDLYDNLIRHLRGLDSCIHLTSLDFSFNKLKHIKNISHLKELRDLYFVQNRISKIEGLEGLLKLRNLELAANRIRTLENLDTLTGLEELWLGKNKITQLENISHLQNLRILSIQSNRLTTLAGLTSLSNLEELYVSHNALTSISGLDSNTKLRVLDISNNAIAHLSGLEHLQGLEEFWASCNQFASFAEVEAQLADKEKLDTVYFEGNPLQLSGPALYRNKVRLALPRVKQIDATYVRA